MTAVSAEGPADPRDRRDVAAAEAATRERLLRSLLRETGTAVTVPGPVRLPVPGPGLIAEVTVASPSGHHCFAGTVTGAGGTPVAHRVVVDAVLAAAGAAERALVLADEIADSTARTARYLAGSRDDWDRRSSEQSLLRGHPFHPTPKSAVGFSDDDLLAYAPELGAGFRLDHVAVDPALVADHRVADGDWGLEPAGDGWPVLPVHPWQARWLAVHPRGAELLADGRLRALGPRGPQVRPTSSVRTVAAPGAPSTWKLPLGVRITHFVRTNPAEHVRRALAAGALVTAVDPAREHPGFEILVETGARGIDPRIGGADLADGLTVLFRDPPHPDAAVLAGLLEDGPDGQAPALAGLVRAAGGDTEDWVRRHLSIAILPLLRIFDRYGIGFEAHVQNSLLVTRDGRPELFQVRDMEGTHVARDGAAGATLETGSPLLYDRAEAWQRLRYHVITNHLAHLLATLARAGTPTEAQLWAVASAELAAAGSPSATALTTDATLPAKANLAARVGGRGERPDYVEIPNPLREAAR
ncbi:MULTISPECIES: IucA/IucC family siderophore biosynthesis protein [unclassified Pseudonocardia]|uniref:IucA/IucC family protein n=1 Tax=unclassified Pseudonocardia TaxID=2619320 RepID=UPI00143C1143|nr:MULTISPECIES: IucA/IucC family protein [unclassified Pseudonocardia]